MLLNKVKKRMKTKRFIAAIGVCFISAISIAQSPVANFKKVTAKDVRAMIDLSAGPMIINFWASWCGPCIREIPYFEARVAQSTQPVKLVLVSLDLPQYYPKQFNEFLKKKDYKSDVLVLSEANVDYLVIDKKWKGAIPASIFVDNSKKYYQLFNMQLTEPRLDIELKNLLN